MRANNFGTLSTRRMMSGCSAVKEPHVSPSKVAVPYDDPSRVRRS
jgi:hypothetical protein